MDPLRIVFLDRDTLPASIDIPAPAVPHEWVAHARTRPDQVAERIRDADIIVTNKVALTAAVLQLPATPAALVGAGLCFGLRVLAIRNGWQLPVAAAPHEGPTENREPRH